MTPMEIERKFTVKNLPANLESYPYHIIEQGYLSTEPVVRVRREDNSYYLTYKGGGLMAREEYNLPLTAASYQHLLAKADGTIISKKRYCIPFATGGKKSSPLTIELDLFDKPFAPLVIAEVEFESVEAAKEFTAPDWFDEEVTFDKKYHNSNMSQQHFT